MAGGDPKRSGTDFFRRLLAPKHNSNTLMKGHRMFRLAAGVLACVSWTAFASTVQIDAGKLSGESLEDGIRVFRGIPYAAAPVGDRRWRPPAPVAGWNDTRDATEFGKICPQPPSLAAMTGGELPATSEDCLFLNVWTPAASTDASLPVMVWIHGGGLSLGWSNQNTYDGVEFAKRGVILVSINYRLGSLGYLAHPGLSKESPKGVSGNYGFLDQVAALQWVQRNIEAFGGDPDRVTIFGESAGATSVFALLASPATEGLLHRAISQSAWVTDTNMTPLKQAGTFAPSAEELGATWAKKFVDDGDVDASVAALRKLPADQLGAGDNGFQPVITVDGWFMPENGESLFLAGKQRNVPVIAGSNADEGTMFMGDGYQDQAAFAEAVRQVYGPLTNAILDIYPVDGGVRQAANQMLTDTWFLRATRTMLEGMDKVSAPAYQYHFTRINPAAPMLGAHHAAELGYVFNVNLNIMGGQTIELDAIDQKLAETMIGYWSQFAKTGDPNSVGLPVWPAYEPDTKAYMELGDRIEAKKALGKDRLDSLDRVRSAAKAGG